MFMDLLRQYGPSVILAIVVIAILIILYRCGRKDMVKAFIYNLVCEAEKAYGSKTGVIKRAAVMGWLYQRLPLLSLLLPTTTLEKYIQEGVDKLKEELSKPGTNLLSYNEEQARINN